MVVNSHGQPLSGQSVYIYREFLHAKERATDNFGSVPVSTAGTFEVESLPPGEYRFVVRDAEGSGQDARIAEAAAVPIVVDGGNLSGIAIVTSAGWSMTGTIVADPSWVRPPRVKVDLQAVQPDRDPRLGNAPSDGLMRDDGSFAVTRAFGPTRLRVAVPEGWMVQTVTHNGRDITDALLDAKSGDVLSGVTVVLTNRVTHVNGFVVDSAGNPTGDANLIIFSVEPNKWWEGSRFVRTTRPEESGRYWIDGLPAGDYLAVAVASVSEAQLYDPEFLKSLRPHATHLSLGSGETRVLSLRLMAPNVHQ
jgi:hypothetical protein